MSKDLLVFILQTALFAGLFSIGLSCSSSGVKGDTSAVSGHSDFPEGYRNWHKANKTTIFRDAEGEAREIYFSAFPSPTEAGGGFRDGTMLVKEQYRIVKKGGDNYEKGELFQISVMKRSSAQETGWIFLAFDPYSKAALETEGCVFCHSKRKSFNYLFTDFGK